MKNINKYLFTAFLMSLSMMFSLHSYAHIMVAQHGTLNVLDDGVFMVLSLPVSAFKDIDDDKDGMLSKAEFTLYRPAIASIILEKVVLKDKNGKLPLQGLMLSPVTPHSSPNEPASQIIVMGRFALVNSSSALQYQIELFGKAPSEQFLEITATHKMDGKEKVAVLSPKKSNVSFFEEKLLHLADK